jgi:hypothetical protein
MHNATRLRTAIAVMLALALSSLVAGEYDDVPYEGGKGKWGWTGYVAHTAFENGIGLYVLFNPESGCDLAHFAIGGNDQIKSISFTIDSHQYRSAKPELLYLDNGVSLAGFTLSQQALRDLKSGYYLRIETDEGTLLASL